MKTRMNLMGACLLATFVVIFGSVLSMVFFTNANQPAAMQSDPAADPG